MTILPVAFIHAIDYKPICAKTFILPITAQKRFTSEESSISYKKHPAYYRRTASDNKRGVLF